MRGRADLISCRTRSPSRSRAGKQHACVFTEERGALQGWFPCVDASKNMHGKGLWLEAYGFQLSKREPDMNWHLILWLGGATGRY
eukprot:3168588-Amphidinium_carterae.1